MIKTKTKTRPLLCKLNVNHKWRWRTTDDGSPYRRCARCGKDDSRTRGPLDQSGFGLGVSDVHGF